MGFLDFLKKEKSPVYTAENVAPPPAAPDVAVPPIPGAVPPALEMPEYAAPRLQGQEISDIFADKDSIDINEIERKLGISDTPQGPKPSAPEPPVPPQSAAKAPPIDLPDFTEEDIAALTPKPQAPEDWSAPEPEPKAAPTIKLVTETPVVPLPANAIAMPEDDLPPIELPTGGRIEESKVEPAKFLSADTYFTINAHIKATRRTLRQSDDAIKEATLRHEQLDQQCKRVASDMHAVQEHLMRIDEALFE